MSQAMYLDLLEKVIVNQINPENGARVKWLVDLLCQDEVHSWDRMTLIDELVHLHHRNDGAQKALGDLYLPRHWWTKTLGFPYSMIGPDRMRNVRLLTEAVLADGVHGAMVETGVWRGGACMMMKGVMRAHNQERPLFVCDSFGGLPALDSGPDKTLKLDENPILTAPLEDVRSHFERLELLDDQVYFIKGWFEDTMDGVADQVDKEGISLLRLDGDYYKSTMDVLEPLFPKVNKGGYVVIDDYNAYEQCKIAVDEYRERLSITDEIIPIDELSVYWKKS